MEKMLRDKRIILLFVLPALTLYLVVVFAPVVMSLVMSLFNWNIVGKPRFIGASNFWKLFVSDDTFLTSFGNTMLVMLVSMVTQIPIAFLLAALLHGELTSFRIRGAKLFKTLVFVPQVISSIAIGLLWYFLLHPEIGLVNRFLTLIGQGSLATPWLGTASTALGSVLVALGWQYVGYHMILLYSGMANIPRSIYESAKIDGASGWTSLMRITLPLVAPILVIDAVLLATGALRAFDLIWVMTEGGPNHASEVLSTYMYIRAFRGMQFGYGSAIGVGLLVLSVVVTTLFNRVFRTEKQELS